jgi:magnesium-transporting ATPase (P-type)
LKVIARATSEDKLLLINLINKMGGIIGMTGDSISDAGALK